MGGRSFNGIYNNQTMRKPTKILYRYERKPNDKGFVLDEYKVLKRYDALDPNNEYIMKLCEELIHWAEHDDDALTMLQFLVKKKMLPSEFARLCDKHSELKRANEFALSCMGARRMVGGLKRKFDSGLIGRTQGMYDKEYKENEMFNAKIRQIEEHKSDRTIIVIPDLDKLKDIK